MSWSTRFTSLKIYMEFSIFHFVSPLLKSIFLFNKIHALFSSKISEIIKFNDIYMTWSSQKSELVTNFLNLENQSFENVIFS